MSRLLLLFLFRAQVLSVCFLVLCVSVSMRIRSMAWSCSISTATGGNIDRQACLRLCDSCPDEIVRNAQALAHVYHLFFLVAGWLTMKRAEYSLSLCSTRQATAEAALL